MAKKPSAAQPPAPVGRPSIYSPELIATICARIAGGESMRSVTRDEAMPAMTTLFRWLRECSDFKQHYAIAMEQRSDMMFEDIVEIADEECTMVKKSKHGDDDAEGELEVVFDATAVARNRLRVDARKWMLSKMIPKKYGDKVTQEHTGAEGGPVLFAKIERVVVDPK